MQLPARTSSYAAGSVDPGAIDRSHAGEPALFSGRVIASGAQDQVRIATETDEFEARLAVTCLVAPQPGDRVLVSRLENGCFVLAILERLIPSPVTLRAAGDSLTIEAARLTLAARETLSVSAPAVDIVTPRFTLAGDALAFLGKLTSFVGDRLRLSSRTQEVAADTIATTARERVSAVAGTDMLRAGNLVSTIDGVVSTQTEAAVIAAREEVRIDGKRVTMG